MAALTDQAAKAYRVRLEARRDALREQYELGRDASGTVVLDQSKVGRLSRMDAIQQQKMAESNLVNIAASLKKVNTALAKLDNGDYGYCDECGKIISPSRLQVQPEAPLCFDCQSRQEYHPQS